MALVTTKAFTWVPAANTGVSVTPSGTSWANSSWVELIASTSGAIQIEEIMIETGLITIEFEVDIGKGAAGSETAVGTIRGSARGTTTTEWMQKFALLIDNIPTSTRVAVRMRKFGTSTAVWQFALGYYNATDSTDTTVNAQLVVPSAADGISVTPSGTAWANGNYAELTAGIANAIWFSGLALIVAGIPREYEIDIATGAAASEVVVSTVRGVANGDAGNAIVILPHPISIATSTRIAIRIRTSTTSTVAWTFAGMYYVQEVSLPTGNNSLLSLMGFGN